MVLTHDDCRDSCRMAHEAGRRGPVAVRGGPAVWVLPTQGAGGPQADAAGGLGWRRVGAGGFGRVEDDNAVG